ncbi:MAG: sulfite oxidase [Planctomycetota bacterium]
MPDKPPPLIPILDRPFNAETPLPLLAAPITPTESVFVRSHFDVPAINPDTYSLTLDGLVGNPLRLTLADLQKIPTVSILLTTECAGNGRTSLNPRPAGVAWGFGAVSTIRYTGVPLKKILDLASPGRALEVIFTAADSGNVDGQPVTFARSLPLAIARLPDTLLAWSMNDAPLTPAHGAPLRLIVPGWYGMASVKWLTRITLTTELFTGHFQHNDYVYLRQQGLPDGTPVTLMRVRSVIASPSDGATLPKAPIEITGAAWSGDGEIRKVELSTDDGRTWQQATLQPPTSDRAATGWKHSWTPIASGPHTLIARATDAAGNTQPLDPVWNLRGYGNNSVQKINVTIV